ncbi:MAG: BT4734/BF3469 family protein, partial [Bacteroidales bacterium]
MKINIWSASRKSRKTITLEDLIDQLKTENKNQQIEQLRTARAFADGRLHAPYCDKIPFVGFAAAFRTRNHMDHLEDYNGLVLLEINRLATRSDAEVLKERLRAYPQIALAFVGCSGLSVKFLVRFALPDGSLPSELHTAELFHAHACQKALDYYKMQIDPRIVLRSDKLDACCRFSYDPNPYVNLHAMPICMDQPVRGKVDNQWERPLFESDFNPDNEKCGLFFRSQEELRSYYFSSALLDAMEVEHTDDPDVYRRNFLIAYMQGCFGSGIGEEEAVHNVLRYGGMRDHETEVRSIFRAGYEMEKRFGNKPSIPKVQHDTL